VEGVIAPESANNGKEGGALLTTLALGIPGSAEMVVLLGAFLMLGIRPGPSMMTQYLPLSFKLIQILFIGSLIGGVVCFFLAPRLARVAMLPARILVPLVTVLVFVGTFSHQERLMDLVVLLVVGLLGLAMKKYGFNRPALLLGWVLGNLFEKYLFIAYGTAGPLFFVRPISLTLIAVLVGLFLFQPVKKLFKRTSAAKEGQA
jgi:putative tricarboxylic transport membrane protein